MATIKTENYKKIKFSEEMKSQIIMGNTYSSIENIDAGNLDINKLKERFLGNNIYENTSTILKACGYSNNNTVYFQILTLLKMAIIASNRKGAFISGQQATAKSALYTMCFKDIVKITGFPTPKMLRGDARSNDSHNECLLDKKVIVLEEVADSKENASESIGMIKDVFESGKYYKNQSEPTDTNTSIVVIGNEYTILNSFNALGKKTILRNFPNSLNERALIDRICLLLPHYKELNGNISYIEANEEKMPVSYLEKIIFDIKEQKRELIINSNEFESRELKIYNEFAFILAKLYYKKVSEVPKWFIDGWVEFLKHFRGLLINDSIYNLFNKKSVRLIIEMLGYNHQEIEYVAFDNEDRLIIKLLDKTLFYKIALTGFGIESNRIEADFYKNTNFPNILPIKAIEKDGFLLIQESGEYFPDKRIYFDNIREHNNSQNISDREFNQLVFEKMSRGDNRYSFRGIPEFYLPALQLMIQNTFNYNVNNIKFEDFVFDKTSIRILNYAKYLKNNYII